MLARNAVSLVALFTGLLVAQSCLAQPPRERYEGHVVVGRQFEAFSVILTSRIEEIVRVVNDRRETDRTTVYDARLQRVSGLPSGNFVYNLSIIYNGNSDSSAAALWEEVRTELEELLQDAQQRDWDGRSERHESEARSLEMEIIRAKAEMMEAVERLVEYQVEADMGSQLREELAATRGRSRELRLERVGVEARRQALEKRIQMLRQRRGDLGDQPILEELRRAMDLREQLLANASASVFNDTNERRKLVAEAEAKLVEAKVAYYRAKQEIETQAVGSSLREVNDQLSDAIVQQTEFDALAHEVNKLLAELKDQLATQIRAQIEIETRQTEVNMWRQRLELLQQQEGSLREQSRQPRMRITIRPWRKATDKVGDNPG